MPTTGPPPPPGDLPLFLTRRQRATRTELLLHAAAVATTLDERRVALDEVAALNFDVVEAVTMAVARRNRGTPVDVQALSERVRAATTEAILALDGPPPLDLVVWLTPIVRNAVVDFVRGNDARQFA